MSRVTLVQSATPAQGEPLSKTPLGIDAEKESRRRAGRRVFKIGVLVLVLLAGAFVAGTLPRLHQEEEVEAEAAAVAHALPRVTVAVARLAEPAASRELPGNCLPLMEASLFARTTGYLQRRLVDIGEPVKEGQLLAVIDAPDVDDQLAQARANLELARANLKNARANARLAQITLERDQRAGAQAIAPLQLDQDRATVETTKANIQSSEASIQVNEAMVQRYKDLQKFQRITAPFTGIITARNIDKGDLISADSPTATRELYHLMRTDVVRVLVNVPQKFAVSIKDEMPAIVFQREDPRAKFTGKVARTAHALDPNTRTLLTEVQVPNPEGKLRPGMFLQVRFLFQRDVLPVLVPSAAVVTRAGAPRVAVLDDQQKIHYQEVSLGRDYGQSIEVLAGLKAGARIVVHPGDDLPEGARVEAAVLPPR